MKKMEYIILSALLILILLTGAFLGYASIGTLLDRGFIPAVGPYRLLPVYEADSYLKMKTGDLFIAKPIDVDLVKTGDVIAFKRNASERAYAFYQVTDVREEKGGIVVTTHLENQFAGEEVMGLCLYRIPLMGYIVSLTREPVTAVLILIALAALPISFMSAQKRIEKRKREIARKSLAIKMRIKSAL